MTNYPLKGNPLPYGTRSGGSTAEIFLVFFGRSSSSHFAGTISPCVLHHFAPVHMPCTRSPLSSQTRTALKMGGFTPLSPLSLDMVVVLPAKTDSATTDDEQSPHGEKVTGRRNQKSRDGLLFPPERRQHQLKSRTCKGLLSDNFVT